MVQVYGRHATRSGTVPPAGGGAFAMLFPNNTSGTDQSAGTYSAIELANPHQNGLLMFPTGGITIVQKIWIPNHVHEGYHGHLFYARGDGGNPSVESYWGCGNPYPTNQAPSGTSHVWEIAAAGGDAVDFQGRSIGTADPTLPIVKDVVFNQIYQITRQSANEHTVQFFPDAADTGSPNFILSVITVAGYGESDPPCTSPLLFRGDVPWFAAFQHERGDYALDAEKFITPAISLADAILEAADYSQMVTAGGQSGVWRRKNGFNSKTDLAGDEGSGPAWSLNDADNRISLVARL